MTRLFAVILTVVFILYSTAAMATTYIAITAEDVGQDTAVRKVWHEDEVTFIGVYGDYEFEINVSESSPNDIDTCWIYLDGTAYTGTELEFTVEDYRQHYGCVVIKYDNDTYEDAEFHILPAWPTDATVATGATAPAPSSLPTDQTAAQLIYAVAINDPDGPTEVKYVCACEGPGCVEVIGDVDECRKNGTCSDDMKCANRE